MIRSVHLLNVRRNVISFIVVAFLFGIIFMSFAGDHVRFALAATDGTLGATSTGDTTVTVTIPKLVRISGLANLDFGSYDGTTDPATVNDDACIWTNDTSGEYTIEASGDGASNAFTVTDGTDTTAYTVYWNDVTGTSGSVQLTTEVATGTQTGADTSSQSCSGGMTSNLEVRFTRSAILSNQAGTYTGVLSVMVSPVL